MYALIVFLPLVGSIFAGLLSLNNQDRPAELVTVTGLLLSLLFSVIAFAEVAIGGAPITVDIGRWIVSGDFAAQWALRFDTMTAVMLIVVTGCHRWCIFIQLAICRMTVRELGSCAI